MPGTTTVSIEGERFLINGRPTYWGRVFEGHRAHASWGFFDPGAAAGGSSARGDYVEGYQLVPVNWRINTPRKRAFFDTLRQITGA